ncbi:O-antigen ligase family protein [Caulobacter sp. DWP3-1-3b2]|uniref:O-antigen ligase family protein n=1 Tax=Caulobacter sp. DWP3-1-3b2 TaxID=2804643 RepID=UPI003CF4A18F
MSRARRALSGEESVTLRRSGVSASTLFSLIVFIGFLVALGAIGKDLLHNPVKTGVPTDPFAEYFNRARYVLIVICIGVALLKARVYASAVQVVHILPFGFFALLSVIWSPDVITTGRNAFVLFGVIFSLGVISQKTSPRTFLIVLLYFLAIIMLASALLAVLDPELGRHAASDVLEKGHDGKWRGIFAHKNALGFYAAVSSVLFFTQVRISRFNWPYWWAARAAALACLVFSGSANAIVGAAAGCAVYAILRRRATTRLPFLLAVGFAGGALSSIAVNLVSMLGRDTTFTGRTEIWAGALEIWKRSPLLGYSYVAGNTVVLGPELTRMLFSSAVDAHNGYIDILFSLGIVGLGLFLLAVLVSFNYGHRACAAKESPDRSTAVAYMVIAIMSCVMGVAEVSPLRLVGNGGYLFWISLVMLSHPDLRPRLARSETRRPHSRPQGRSAEVRPAPSPADQATAQSGREI